MGQSSHCLAVQGNLHSFKERCASGGVSPIFPARCIRWLFIKIYLYEKSPYSKLLLDSCVQRKPKLQLSLDSFFIFLLFLGTTLASRGVPRGNLWGQGRTGVADVPFHHLPYGNAGHTASHCSSSLNSLPRVRRQLDVKINLTHWQSVKERKWKHCACPTNLSQAMPGEKNELLSKHSGYLCL